MAEQRKGGFKEQRPRFAFILQPEFPLNAFILATEALRIANQNSGEDLFDWLFVSETGKPVRASNGMRIEVESDLGSLPHCDYLILLEGNLPTQNSSSQLLSALRTARCSIRVAGCPNPPMSPVLSSMSRRSRYRASHIASLPANIARRASPS